MIGVPVRCGEAAGSRLLNLPISFPSTRAGLPPRSTGARLLRARPELRREANAGLRRHARKGQVRSGPRRARRPELGRRGENAPRGRRRSSGTETGCGGHRQETTRRRFYSDLSARSRSARTESRALSDGGRDSSVSFAPKRSTPPPSTFSKGRVLRRYDQISTSGRRSRRGDTRGCSRRADGLANVGIGVHPTMTTNGDGARLPRPIRERALSAAASRKRLVAGGVSGRSRSDAWWATACFSSARPPGTTTRSRAAAS